MQGRAADRTRNTGSDSDLEHGRARGRWQRAWAVGHWGWGSDGSLRVSEGGLGDSDRRQTPADLTV
jgi:hypothetical protein